MAESHFRRFPDGASGMGGSQEREAGLMGRGGAGVSRGGTFEVVFALSI